MGGHADSRLRSENRPWNCVERAVTCRDRAPAPTVVRKGGRGWTAGSSRTRTEDGVGLAKSGQRGGMAGSLQSLLRNQRPNDGLPQQRTQPSHLKPQKWVVSQSGGWKSQLQAPAGLAPPGGCDGDAVLCLPPESGGSWPSLVPRGPGPRHGVSASVSRPLCSSLTGFGAHSPLQILTIVTSANALFPNTVTFTV